MRDVVRDGLDKININGFKEINEASSTVKKRLWILVVVACNLITLYYAYRVIHECVTQSWLAKVTYEEKDEYSMPNVAFCTTRWFNVSAMRGKGLSIDAIKYGLTVFLQSMKLTNPSAARDELISVLLSHNYPSLTDFFANTSIYSTPGTFSLIDYGTRELIPLLEPSKAIIRDNDLSLCYWVTLGNVSRATVKAGGEYSARKLIVKLDDESAGLNEHDTSYISIISPNAVDVSDSNQYVYLSLHRKHHISIIPKHFDLQNDNCVRSESAIKEESDCHAKCWAQYISDHPIKSNCTTLYHVSTTRERELGPGNISMYCTYKDPENLQLYNHAIVHCTTECKSPCDMEIYDIAQSSTMMGMVENPREMTIVLRLQVEKGILTFRDVNTYSFDTLVANLGGVLGLWLGGDMFTVIQIIVWIWESCINRQDLSKKERCQAEMGNGSDKISSYVKENLAAHEGFKLPTAVAQHEELFKRIDLLEQNYNHLLTLLSPGGSSSLQVTRSSI